MKAPEAEPTSVQLALLLLNSASPGAAAAASLEYLAALPFFDSVSLVFFDQQHGGGRVVRRAKTGEAVRDHFAEGTFVPSPPDEIRAVTSSEELALLFGPDSAVRRGWIVPCRQDGSVHCTLNVGFSAPEPPAPDIRRLVTQIAALIGAALTRLQPQGKPASLAAESGARLGRSDGGNVLAPGRAALASLGEALQPSESLERVLDHIVEATTRMLPASGGASVILWDASAQEFFIRATTIPGQESQSIVERIQREGVATRWIVENRVPLVVPDVREGTFGTTQMLGNLGYQAYAGVPLVIEEQVLGVLYAVDAKPREYTGEDLAFLGMLAGLAALALSKALLADELADANLKLAEKSDALAVANEQLEAYALVVSHDLKAPLRGVRYLLDWLSKEHGHGLSADAAELVKLMDERLDRMQKLIEGVLRYSRSGRPASQEVWFDLNDAVTGALKLVALPDRIMVKIQSELPQVKGDATQMGQVFHNLLTNAVDSIGQRPGSIEIGAYPEGEGWRVFVRDDGSGIKPEDRERIFEPFHSLGGGVGIGLAVVRKIVDSHGGTIWVNSQPGHGSEFVFSLPGARVKDRAG